MHSHKTIQELLAVLLGAAPESDTVKEITARYSSAKTLYQATLEEIQEIKGIGGRKALLLKTALELGFRIAAAPKKSSPSVSSPSEVYDLLKDKMRYLDREHFVAVLLNTKNRVISIDTTSIGSLNSSIVHPREVFKNAIKLSAASLILCHNHPSGICDPSREDLEATKRLVEAGELIGIKVLDHVIIGDGGYFSFKEKSLI